MKVIFAGNNLRGIECLEYLLKKKIKIPLILGHPKKDKSPYFASLQKTSKKYGLNYIAPKNINSKPMTILYLSYYYIFIVIYFFIYSHQMFINTSIATCSY